MATFLLILHLSILILSGSGINWKSSTKLTLRFAAAEEGKNNNNDNNNPVVTNVQCWKGHAVVIPNAGNNSLKSEDFKNINITLRVAVMILRPMILLLLVVP